MSDTKMQSDTLGALGAALAKAQASMSGAKKDRENPHFKSKYADLASIWDACREALGTNGLSVIQQVTSAQGAAGVTVTSTLLHTSGEFIKDQCWLPVTQQSAQGYGSAITYARRYSLAALVGIAAEDDDGNAASAGGQKYAAPTPPPKTAPRTESNRTTVAPPHNPATGEVSDKFDPADEAVFAINEAKELPDPVLTEMIRNLGVSKDLKVRAAYELRQKVLKAGGL